MNVLASCFGSFSSTNFGASINFEGTASNLLLYTSTPSLFHVSYTIEHNTGVITTENVQQKLVSDIPE